MSGCKGSEESAILAPWGGKVAPVTMHRQTSNNKPGGRASTWAAPDWVRHAERRWSHWFPLDGRARSRPASPFSVLLDPAQTLERNHDLPEYRWALSFREDFHVLRHRPQAQFHLSVFRTIFTPARGYIYISASVWAELWNVSPVKLFRLNGEGGEGLERSGKPHIRWKRLT